MRRLVLLFAAILSVTLAFGSDANPDQTKTDLSTALKRSSIRSAGSPPFQLTASFTLNFKTPIDGTYRLFWMSPSVWRHEIVMPGYQEKVVRNGDQEWIDRNLAYPPLHVQQLNKLFEPIHSLEPADGSAAHVHDFKKEKFQGHEVRCATVESRIRGNFQFVSKEKLCFDAQWNLVKRTKDSFGKEDELQFSDFADFGGKSYPRKLQFLSGGGVAVEASISQLEANQPSSGLFLALPAAQMRQTCDQVLPPLAERTPDPQYSESARKAKIEGIATLFVTVGADGRVSDAVIVQTVEPTLDKNAVEAVKRWKFKPALCGATPVPTDITVEVQFRLY